MKIQELRHRVILLKRRVIEEADGSFKEVWQEGDAVWAQIVPCMGREAFGEGWNNLNPAHTKYKVTLRYRKGWFRRIQWEDITLALLGSPLKDPHRQWITCLMYALGENNE